MQDHRIQTVYRSVNRRVCVVLFVQLVCVALAFTLSFNTFPTFPMATLSSGFDTEFDSRFGELLETNSFRKGDEPTDFGSLKILIQSRSQSVEHKTCKSAIEAIANLCDIGQSLADVTSPRSLEIEIKYSSDLIKEQIPTAELQVLRNVREMTEVEMLIRQPPDNITVLEAIHQITEDISKFSKADRLPASVKAMVEDTTNAGNTARPGEANEEQ